jgi:nuclear pore complex protein Nup62
MAWYFFKHRDSFTITLPCIFIFIPSVSSAPSGTSTSLNFCQLEESINKWTLELEEQEKVFMNQATQVNAWDRLLIGNGEKVKACQTKCELNFRLSL